MKDHDDLHEQQTFGLPKDRLKVIDRLLAELELYIKANKDTYGRNGR
jgi:hypothetical protein